MKKQPAPSSSRNLDKHLFEAGQQCQKRLWLDYHRPAVGELTGSRKALSATGQQLLELARSAFPKGVAVAGKTKAKAAEATAEQIAAGTPVLFGATFVAEGVEVQCDILILHKDGSIDVYEVKSGTKVKQRYVNDLALQVHVAGLCGLKVRAAFLLHVNPKYTHKEGADYPPMQLLRSADVTEKVKKQVELTAALLAQFRQQLGDEGSLQLPMGTFCTNPLPCPHLAACTAEAPPLPLRELPDLSRRQELALHEEGIEDLAAIAPQRSGLTFKQRRTLTSIQQGQPILEPFVREELRQCSHPLHFVEILTLTEPLPRFDGQRPWRQLPYAWAASTLYKDGRVESAVFAHADRTDPRLPFISSLAKHVENGGTIVVWNDEALEGLRALLDDLPAAKIAVRAVLGRSHLDLMKLFDAGIYHPRLRGHTDLRTSVAVLLEQTMPPDLAVQNDEQIRETLERAFAPRIRSSTKEKIGAELQAYAAWHAAQLLALYQKYADVASMPRGKQVVTPTRASTKQALPKPLPKE